MYKIMIGVTIPLALILSGFAMGFLTMEKELFMRIFLSAVAVGAWSYIVVVSNLMDTLTRTEKMFETTKRELSFERATKTINKLINNK